MPRVLVNPLGLNQDVPVDGGAQSIVALLFLIASQQRATNQYLYAIATGRSDVDPPDAVVADNLNEATFARAN